MPVPAAPRRAAPPRRKKDTPKPSEEPPAPPQEEEETAVPEAKIPLPESTSNLLADVEREKTEALPDIESKSVSTMEPSPPPVKDESPDSAKDSGLVTERSTSPTLPGDHDEVPEEARIAAPQVEGQPVPPLSEEELVEVVEEGKKEIEERSGIDQPEQGLEEPLNEVSSDEETTEPFGTAVEKEHPKALAAEPDIKEDAESELGEQPEEEEEAARRARISTRLAKSGGFNPFAGGPPVRKPSESSLPERRTSLESPGPFKPTLHEEQELPAQPLARRDADSLNDEASVLTTETKEEDKPFDTLKSVEGDS